MKWTIPAILPIRIVRKLEFYGFRKAMWNIWSRNILPAGQKIDELTFTMEISSEALPGFNNDWPSDITFLLNDTPVGVWTSPGDFGDRHGLFTPNWWFSGWNQYGLLKMLVIDQNRDVY